MAVLHRIVQYVTRQLAQLPRIPHDWRQIRGDIDCDIRAAIFLAVTQMVNSFHDDACEVDGRLGWIIFLGLNPAKRH